MPAAGSTEARQARRATEEMKAERAALAWARAQYPTTSYRVRITGVEDRLHGVVEQRFHAAAYNDLLDGVVEAIVAGQLAAHRPF